MSLGFDRELNVINVGDSADLYAYLYNEREIPIPEEDLLSVEFTEQAPDGSKASHLGEILGNGKGFVRIDDTAQIGEHKVVATFTLADGAKRSVRSDFEVIDPFNPPTPSDEDVIADLVWFKLSDLFDSEEGGPWLQDETLNTFKKEKIKGFIKEGLFDINNQQPTTSVVLGEFVREGVPQDGATLLAQGTLIAVIRHFIRTYVEQPLPTGGQIVYEDRRDYLQRWQSVLQTEEEHYLRQLLLWKRKFLGLGETSLLIGSKAGRLTHAPMRTRWVGRGY